MRPLIAALWEGEQASAVEEFSTNVMLVEQQYQLEDSDPPYTLGPSTTRVIVNRDDFGKVIAALKARVGEQDGDLIPNPRDAVGTSWDETFSAVAPDPNTIHCAITLEIGDAEHVLLAAFDRDVGSIRAIYTN